MEDKNAEIKTTEDKKYIPEFPETVVWELTLNCNMKCIHCGSSAIPGEKLKNELNTNEALDLVHQFAEIGAKRIIVSGGEPFLRQDWDVLAEEIARIGIKLAFISNGFIVDENIVKKLVRLKDYCKDVHVGISVDGIGPTHDHLRQTQDCYKHALKALEILKKEGVPTAVITTVSRLNFKELPEIRDTIFKYDIYNWQMQMATVWGRFTKDMMLDQKEYMSFLYFIVEQKKQLGNKVTGTDNCGYYTFIEEKLRPGAPWHGCHAGLKVLGMRSNGEVMGCLSLQGKEFIEGSIRQKRLKDFWFDPEAFSYNRKFRMEDLKGYCRECPNGARCRAGCKNSAYAVTKTLGENKYCAFRIMLGK